MWPYPQVPADLVAFTEEILNWKLHFLWSVDMVGRFADNRVGPLIFVMLCDFISWFSQAYLDANISTFNIYKSFMSLVNNWIILMKSQFSKLDPMIYSKHIWLRYVMRGLRCKTSSSSFPPSLYSEKMRWGQSCDVRNSLRVSFQFRIY